MLPFALKALWFSLCATGTIATWVVLGAMAKAIDLYWLPILYCIGLTVLEGIFCLGMIYRMDPFQMPQAFCYAQIFLISLSALLLTGVCVTIILAMTISILWPSTVDTSPQSALRWRPIYLIPLIVIPVVFPVIQLVLVIQKDAAKPSDNIHCDITGPNLWISLLGYSGMPMLESLPCFFITILAAIRVYRMHEIQRRSSSEHGYSENSVPPSNSTQMSSISKKIQGESIIASIEPLEAQTVLTPRAPAFASLRPPSIVFAQARRGAPSPMLLTRPEFSSFKFPAESRDASPSSPVSLRPRERSWAPSIASTSAPSMHTGDNWNPTITGTYPTYIGFEQYDKDESSSRNFSDDEISVAASNRVEDSFLVRSVALEPAKEEEVSRTEDLNYSSKPTAPDDNLQLLEVPDSHGRFVTLVWRLILFFFFFFLIQILVTLSTLIDIGSKRHSPTPFGTQHVALLLAAWGPSVIFAHAPGIRQKLIFWR